MTRRATGSVYARSIDLMISARLPSKFQRGPRSVIPEYREALRLDE
jgi:hypothetical protein